MIKPAQGAFDFEIEADVFVRNGQACGEEAKRLVDGARDSLFVKRSQAQCSKRIVAGEELIAAITAEGNCRLGVRRGDQEFGAMPLGLHRG